MQSLELLSLSQSFVLSILRGPLFSSMPCQSLSFPEIFILEQHQLNELYVVRNYQNHLGIVALSISPFLVIDDNIQIKASTNDNKIEIHRRFEKYVISKSSPKFVHYLKFALNANAQSISIMGYSSMSHTSWWSTQNNRM